MYSRASSFPVPEGIKRLLSHLGGGGKKSRWSPPPPPLAFAVTGIVRPPFPLKLCYGFLGYKIGMQMLSPPSVVLCFFFDIIVEFSFIDR